MESSPSEPSNSGSSTSIDSAAMSSSFNESTISSLISVSSISADEPLIVEPFETPHDIANRYRPMDVALPRLGVEPADRRHLEHGPVRGDRPPLLPFGQRRRRTGDQQELDIGLQKCSDMGKAAVEPHRLSRPRPGSLRKDDQGASVRQRLAAGSDERLGFEIGTDVPVGPHDRAEERARPQLALDDALDPRDGRRDQHHIDQAGMVRHHDRAPALAEGRDLLQPDRNDTEARQHADEEPERPADQDMVALA